jgi:hypothetical protein
MITDRVMMLRDGSAALLNDGDHRLRQAVRLIWPGDVLTDANGRFRVYNYPVGKKRYYYTNPADPKEWRCSNRRPDVQVFRVREVWG